ncbi:NUDIX domain-containing protein [Patescibacteria group bacterium]|nr:NUDIX domain-containing protein [Patescibacteria group bacterium]
MNAIPQFGEVLESYTERPGAYAVLFDEQGDLLCVEVRGRYHLPGGGIEQGEEPEGALRREIREETGYEVAALYELGRANQFLQTKDLGPVNKIAVYFQGTLSRNASKGPSQEVDHVPVWIRPEAFLASTAQEFHRWAVRNALEQSITR